MFRRILVPVDGSQTSARGLTTAIRMAKGRHSTLCLLHIVDERPLTQAYEGSGDYFDRLLQSLREGGRRILARAASAAGRHGVKVQTVLVENMIRPVADLIVKEARRRRADLIVLGTHGRRGISRLVMGSDAEGVVRTASVPVLLVRSRADRR